MHKHSDEEHGVEIRNRGGKANNGAPSERHDPVGNIILRKTNISDKLVKV